VSTEDRIRPPRLHRPFIVLGEANLRRVLKSYATYSNANNAARTYRSLNKDSHSILGGLQHQYSRTEFSIYAALTTTTYSMNRSRVRNNENGNEKIVRSGK
jgi:hypothetical protein